MNALAIVQSRLAKTSGSLTAQLALQWFSNHSAKPVSAEPADVTAAEALRLWRTRQRTAQADPQGIPELILQLEELAPQRKVEQFSFSDTNSTAVFFFTKTEGLYLGSVVVQTDRERERTA
jgi:hypothetical protein